MNATLNEIVETAYRVFADATIGRQLHVCTCNVCFGEDSEAARRLATTPLREIPADLLAEYTNSAHEWHDEMLYFMPRYLELIAAGEAPCHLDLDYALARLRYVDWRGNWPRERREVVERFFSALVVARLHDTPVPAWRHPDGVPDPYYWGTPLEDVFCMVSNADGEIGPLLQILDDSPGLATSLHIAAIVNDAGSGLMNGSLGWHTLGQKGAAERLITGWLRRPRMLERLEAAFFGVEETIDQNTLSLAVTILGAAVETTGLVADLQ